MSQPQFTPDDFIEVRVVEPGDDCNLYVYDPDVPGLRLSGVHRTSQPAPVDHAVVPETSPDGDADLDVLLVSHRSTLPGCMVIARPIALLEVRRNGSQDYRIVAVPAADDALSGVRALQDLAQERRQAIAAFAQASLDGQSEATLLWGDAARASQVIHQAKQAARLARAKARKSGSAAPAWKPLGRRVLGARRASDTEPHTEAEYAYQQLPHRFQKYVEEYLAHDERILFAVNRPAMPSALKRTWFARETLQEGILFITDQQVALVTEILPPGESNVRYGYIVHTGIPERLASVSVESIGGSACFHVTWRAVGGEQRATWEFPAQAADELREGAELLRRWQPIQGDQRLRRAYGPEPVEMELRDPAANDPQETASVAQRLTEALQRELANRECVLARALLPGWADRQKVARMFAVTDRRAVLLPDPSGNHRLKPDSYWSQHITSVEYTSSILESWLALNVLEMGKVRRVTIDIPNTAAAFHVCFTALRQQLVAIPVTERPF
jgi:inorganic pyrophosphatase